MNLDEFRAILTPTTDRYQVRGLHVDDQRALLDSLEAALRENTRLRGHIDRLNAERLAWLERERVLREALTFFRDNFDWPRVYEQRFDAALASQPSAGKEG